MACLVMPFIACEQRALRHGGCRIERPSAPAGLVPPLAIQYTISRLTRPQYPFTSSIQQTQTQPDFKSPIYCHLLQSVRPSSPCLSRLPVMSSSRPVVHLCHYDTMDEDRQPAPFVSEGSLVYTLALHTCDE